MAHVSRLLAAALVASFTLALPAEPAPVRPGDFRCLTDGIKPPGRNFYVFHRSKRKLRKAVRIAERGASGERYPRGTVLQLFPFEAMVKQRRGSNPDGNDWLFVQLRVTEQGSAILAAGKDEVRNAAGSCQGCHRQLAPNHDLVCEFVVGSAGLGLTDEQVEALQNADPRCHR